MRRRSFLAALGASLLAVPLAAAGADKLFVRRRRGLDVSKARSWALYHEHPPVTHNAGEPYRTYYGGGSTWSLHAVLDKSQADEVSRLWQAREEVYVFFRSDGPRYGRTSFEGRGRLQSFAVYADRVEVVLTMGEVPPSFAFRFN